MKENPVVRLFYRAATSEARYRRLLTPLGPLFFFGFIVAMVLLARATDGLLRLPRFPPEPLNRLLSAPLMVSGAALVLWSASRFRRAHGTPVPFNPPRRLVVDGPYRWSRNPMITGLFIVLWGVALRLGSPSLAALYLPLFVALHVLELKKVEEPELEKRLGEEYRRYRERTPMFLPWRRKVG